MTSGAVSLNCEGVRTLDDLDMEKLERLCALIETVDDERSYSMLLDILKLFVERYAGGKDD